jgi:hypothetical protein
MRSTRPSTGFGTSVFSIRCRVPSPRTMKPCVGLILRCASISRSCSQAALGVKATRAAGFSTPRRQSCDPPGSSDPASQSGDRHNPRRLARGASIAAFCRSSREAVDWQRGRPAPRLDKDRRQQKRGVGRPKTCNRLGNELRRVAPQLRMDGLSITFDRTSKGRLISLELKRCPTPFLGQSALWLEV